MDKPWKATKAPFRPRRVPRWRSSRPFRARPIDPWHSYCNGHWTWLERFVEGLNQLGLTSNIVFHGKTNSQWDPTASTRTMQRTQFESQIPSELWTRPLRAHASRWHSPPGCCQPPAEQVISRSENLGSPFDEQHIWCRAFLHLGQWMGCNAKVRGLHLDDRNGSQLSRLKHVWGRPVCQDMDSDVSRTWCERIYETYLLILLHEPNRPVYRSHWNHSTSIASLTSYSLISPPSFNSQTCRDRSKSLPQYQYIMALRQSGSISKCRSLGNCLTADVALEGPAMESSSKPSQPWTTSARFMPRQTRSQKKRTFPAKFSTFSQPLHPSWAASPRV